MGSIQNNDSPKPTQTEYELGLHPENGPSPATRRATWSVLAALVAAMIGIGIYTTHSQNGPGQSEDSSQLIASDSGQKSDLSDDVEEGNQGEDVDDATLGDELGEHATSGTGCCAPPPPPPAGPPVPEELVGHWDGGAYDDTDWTLIINVDGTYSLFNEYDVSIGDEGRLSVTGNSFTMHSSNPGNRVHQYLGAADCSWHVQEHTDFGYTTQILWICGDMFSYAR